MQCPMWRRVRTRSPARSGSIVRTDSWLQLLFATECGNGLGSVARADAVDVRFGVHILVAEFHRHQVTTLRPSVERGVAHVEHLAHLLRVVVGLIVFAAGGLFQLSVVIRHKHSLGDALGKHFQVGGRHFQFYVCAHLDQRIKGKYHIVLV